MPRIYITEPNHFYTYELPTAPGAEVLIGTAPHCQLALPGVGGLGEVHACISCQPQGYVIADLGSPTGTFANGAPIRSELLRPGVEYRMGAAVITLAVEGMPPQQQPPMGMPMQAPVGMPPQQAPAVAPQQAPVAQAAAQQQAQPAVKKKASPLKTGAAAAGGATKIKAAGKAGKSDLASMAARFDRTRGKGASRATFLYVVVLLVIAFYAGIALHHWERTGNCLPGLVADEQDAPVQPATAPAVASEPSAAEEPAQTDSVDTPLAPEGDTPADETPAAGDESTPEAEEPAGGEDPAPEEIDTPEQEEEPAASED